MAERIEETEETSSSTNVSWVKGDIHIDPQYASRSICVTGFPVAAKPEQLIIHFQRKKNGGGDIDAIAMNKQGVAVITFENPEVVESVQQREQKFEEVVLAVKPYVPENTKMVGQNAEVFELVSAELCLATVEFLTRPETKSLLEQIADKTGINWIDSSETFIMSGSLKQIEVSRVYLQQAINQYGGIEEFSEMRRKCAPSQESKESEAGEYDEEELARTDPRRKARHMHSHPQDQEPDATQTNYMASSPSLEVQYFEVEPKFIKVFVKAYEAELKSIETKYHVNISREAKGKQICLAPTDSSSIEEYEKACDKFIELYQKMVPTIDIKRFSLKHGKNVVHARNKIHEMGKKFPVLVEVAKDQKHWELFGQVRDLKAALDYLKKEKIEIIMESGKGTGGASDHEEAMKDDSPDYSRGSPENYALETYIGKVKVSVYQGDLTRERADVIVNASNNRLEHAGGVAKVILDRGGKVIEKESKRIIQERGQLKDGDAAITSSGKLPSKKVVHVVGPDCRNVELSHGKRVLRQACINSFKIAQEAKMTSIALPAIGSGIYGMPKDACAKVMFDAVEEFAKKGDPKKKTITDVRFVNIDDASIQAFRKEFISRYGQSQDGGHGSFKVPPTGAEGAAQPSRPRRGKNKDKNPNGPTTSPSLVVGSHHHDSGFGSAAIHGYHPLSSSSDPSSSDLSYSGAVKKTVSGSGAESKTEHSLPPEGKGAKTDKKEEDPCPICLEALTKPRRLKCKHAFCSECLQRALDTSNKCPVCQEPQGVLQGNQPPGHMGSRIDPYYCVPGYEGYGTIIIDYYFPSGTQGPEHPNPGQRFSGTSRTAYLPDTREGREVLQLLKRAFDARLVFTIGTSNTTGLSNQVTWNDIHHKTSVRGGPYQFGYPDPDYFRRVKEELAAKGIR